MVIVEKYDRVALLRLNRPNKLNALNTQMMDALIETLQELEHDRSVQCVVITGSEKAFCAGADIAEMAAMSYQQMVDCDYFSGWEALTRIRTIKIAAVSGIAYGGGCELAMMCDLIFAAQSARFAQPEIKLGVIPGIGATQRLARLVGQKKAMDMILTGDIVDAATAERIGLVSRVFDDMSLIEQSLRIAGQIASYSADALSAARESVQRAEQVSLSEGLLFERRLFHALFNTPGQQEGMRAFLSS